MRGLLSLSLGIASFLNTATSSSLNSTNREQSYASDRLRRRLLRDYDRHNYPFEDNWIRQNRTGIDIFTQILFVSVYNIDETASVADLNVWFKLRWYDPRLQWSPSLYDGRSELLMWPGDSFNDPEIWVPDVELWNQDIPMEKSLTRTHVRVSSTGRLLWNRPGHLKISCNFQGLERFPFDTLRCPMEFGSWAYGDTHIRTKLYLDGVQTTERININTGETNVGYTFKNITAEPGFYQRSGINYTSVIFNVTFSRAWRPYIWQVFLKLIIFSAISFCCLWIHPSLDRIGLAITCMLASEFAELKVANELPLSRKTTFYSKFLLYGKLFSVAVIFESTVVVFLHHYDKDDLIPDLIKWISRKIRALWTRVQDGNLSSVVQVAKETEQEAIKELENEEAAQKLIGKKAQELDRKRANNKNWVRLAKNIDQWARVVVPACYAVFLSIHYVVFHVGISNEMRNNDTDDKGILDTWLSGNDI